MSFAISEESGGGKFSLRIAPWLPVLSGVIIAAAFVMAAATSGGLGFYLFVLPLEAALIWRLSRVGIVADRSGVTVRNFWRTVEVPWRDVTSIDAAERTFLTKPTIVVHRDSSSPIRSSLGSMNNGFGGKKTHDAFEAWAQKLEARRPPR